MMTLNDCAEAYNGSLSVTDSCVQLLRQSGNEEALSHVLRVAQTGAEIAKAYDLDKDRVETACYLHDISAVIPQEDYVAVCENYGVEVLDLERAYPTLLHQRVSRLIAEQAFGVRDEEILSAVEYHTTLRANPGDIDMAVFVADKLSRDEPFNDRVSQALKTSLEKACLEYINYCLRNGMILIPHPLLLEAKDYLGSLQHFH